MVVDGYEEVKVEETSIGKSTSEFTYPFRMRLTVVTSQPARYRTEPNLARWEEALIARVPEAELH